MKIGRLLLGFLIGFSFLVSVLKAQNGIKVTSYVTGLTIPVDIAHAGDESLFVVEKTGRIRIIENGTLVREPYLDIVAKVNSRGNEQGLLGLAFHPDYKTNGYFYVNYINKNAQAQTVIARYKVSDNPNRADSLSEKILMTVNQPFANHNGGCLKFGKDGYLYIAHGDGGSGGDPQNHGQNRKSLLGKMLRMDVNGPKGFDIPADNPFVNDPNTAPEIWTLGWRNPWRFSFDRLTGDMWIGDVGQGDWEEVDVEWFGDPGGKNYGWRCYEGKHVYNTSGCQPQNNYSFPLHEYISDESIAGCSVTGGFVYRGNKNSYLYGKYIYGDYCSGKIWAITVDSGDIYKNEQLLDFNNNSITSFGEDLNGELYFSFPGQGAIYKISDTCNIFPAFSIVDPLCDSINSGSISISIAQSENYLVRWSTGDTTLMIDSLNPGKYSVEIIRGNCRFFEEFVLTGKALDSICITTPFVTEICKGDSALLIACDAFGDYQWFKDSIEIMGANSKRIYLFEEGNYQVQLIDTTGCRSALSEPVFLKVFPLPAKPEIKIDGDTLKATTGYQSYRWFKDDVFFASSISSELLVTEKAYYRVQVVDSNLCQTVWSDSVYFIPTATKHVDDLSHCLWYYKTSQSELHITCFDLPISTPLKYQVFSVQGEELESGSINGSHVISLYSVPAGVYVVAIQNNSARQTIRIVKSL